MNKIVAYHNNIDIDEEVNNNLFFIQEIKYMPMNKNLTTPPIHRHPFNEIILVTQGECIIEVDFKEYTLTKGSLGLFSPSQIHHPIKASTDYKAYLIRFYSTIFDNLDFFKEIRIFDFDYIKLQEKHYARTKMLLEELIIEFDEIQVLKDFALGNLLKCFLITIQRALPETVVVKSCTSVFSKLNLLIVENEFKIAKPSDYADKLRLSSRSLNTITKEHVGISTGEYIRSKTIFEAQRLLSYTLLNIKEIAYKLGFDDIAYFSRFFKKVTNISPLQYRDDFLSSNLMK